MAVVLACPSGHRLKVPSKYAGTRVVCPVCGGRIDVPAAESSEPLSAQQQTEQDQSIDQSIQMLAKPVTQNELTTPSPPLSDWPQQVVQTPETLDTFTSSATEELPVIQIITDRDKTFQSTGSARITDYIRSQASEVVALSIAAIMVAVLCSVPSILEQFRSRNVGIRSPDPWSFFVLLMVTIQIAVAIFTIRIPDWCTTWMLCLIATMMATIYAATLALTMFATQSHVLLRQLGLLDEAFLYRAQPWCFAMMCTLLTLALFCGRHSYRWHEHGQSEPMAT